MPATLTAGDEMLREIIAHPERDDVRLIYADWLEEEGDDPGWAVVIRLGVQYASLVRKKSAIRSLARYNLNVASTARFPRSDWGVDDWTWDRGFIRTIRLPLAAWRQHGPSLVRSHPIIRVELSDRESGHRSWMRHDHGDDASGWFPGGTVEDCYRLSANRNLIPDAVINLMPPEQRHGNWMCFRSPADADAALSGALLEWVRPPASGRV